MPILLSEQDKKAKFLEYFSKYHGVVQMAINEMNKDRYPINAMWVHRRRKKDKRFNAAISDLKEVTFRYVENKLFTLIEKGNSQAILFYLKTHSKEYQVLPQMTLETKTTLTMGERSKILNEIIEYKQTQVIPDSETIEVEAIEEKNPKASELTPN